MIEQPDRPGRRGNRLVRRAGQIARFTVGAALKGAALTTVPAAVGALSADQAVDHARKKLEHYTGFTHEKALALRKELRVLIDNKKKKGIERTPESMLTFAGIVTRLLDASRRINDEFGGDVEAWVKNSQPSLEILDQINQVMEFLDWMIARPVYALTFLTASTGTGLGMLAYLRALRRKFDEEDSGEEKQRLQGQIVDLQGKLTTLESARGSAELLYRKEVDKKEPLSPAENLQLAWQVLRGMQIIKSQPKEVFENLPEELQELKELLAQTEKKE